MDYHRRPDGMQAGGGPAKIPRQQVPYQEGNTRYPAWLLQSLQFDLARTVTVHLSGDPDKTMEPAVRAAFCKDFGEKSVELCSGTEGHFNGVFYVRLNDATNCKNGETKAGCQCAYEAVESLDKVPLRRLRAPHACQRELYSHPNAARRCVRTATQETL